jgi:hypothetical protein
VESLIVYDPGLGEAILRSWKKLGSARRLSRVVAVAWIISCKLDNFISYCRRPVTHVASKALPGSIPAMMQ